MHNKKMENAKDFKGSLKRLILELKPFKVLIFISLILAIFGSTLTISAPNRLSKLTDEMLQFASQMEFEKAAELRDKIKELEKLIQ